MEEAAGQAIARRAWRPSCRAKIDRLCIPVLIALSLSFVQAGCNRHALDAAIQRDVYLLLVDTLRADHLGLYGYGRPTSPNLDHFAESARVFEKVVAAAPWTHI